MSQPIKLHRTWYAAGGVMHFIKFWLLIGAVVLGSAWLASKTVRADDYITVTTTSYHFNRAKDYNEKNFGLGYERRHDENWRYHAGAYRNSLDRTTVYALASYTPYRFGEWQVGGAAGLGTGYNSRPIGVLVGGFAIREWRTFGVNVIVHPAAVALQVKVKFK